MLAISGLNMVLAAGTFLIGARMALAAAPGLAETRATKKIAALGALVMVTAYILVSGGAISALRAWIMISIMLVAVFFDRIAISLRNVALSALLILAVTPSAITGPGFQMSYAATLGLVAGYAAWRERPRQRERADGRLRTIGRPVLHFFGGLLLSSLIGGIATLIYSIGHFHRIPAYGLLGNLVAMPVISVIVMPMGLVAVLLIPFGLDAIPFRIMGQGIDWMISLSHWVSGFEGEVVTGRIPDATFLLVGLGGGVLCILRTRLRLAGLAMVAVGTGLAMIPDRRPPVELVVSEDGRLVAIVNGKRVAASNRARPPDFIFEQWSRGLRLAGHVPPQILPGQDDADAARAKKAAAANDKADRSKRRRIDTSAARQAMAQALAANAGDPVFRCQAKAWCAAKTPSGWKVVTLDDPAYLGPACDSADIVIAAQHLRRDECRSGARLFTARSLRRTGALEFRAQKTESGETPPSFALTQAIGSLDRPWSRHRTYDWRTGGFGDEEPVTPSSAAVASVNDSGE